MGRYVINEDQHTADVALLVRESRRSEGVGTEILSYLKQIARRRGLSVLRLWHQRERIDAPFFREDGLYHEAQDGGGEYLLEMHSKP
jgi:GNAT superfamily N-acetyltransferase